MHENNTITAPAASDSSNGLATCAPSEFYGDGTALPELHPDRETNLEILVTELSARLDTARTALGKVLDLQVITANGTRVKDAARYALKETDPRNLGDMHPNCG